MELFRSWKHYLDFFACKNRPLFRGKTEKRLTKLSNHWDLGISFSAWILCDMFRCENRKYRILRRMHFPFENCNKYSFAINISQTFGCSQAINWEFLVCKQWCCSGGNENAYLFFTFSNIQNMCNVSPRFQTKNFPRTFQIYVDVMSRINVR